MLVAWMIFFFSSRRRHTRLQGDWSSDVCSSDPTLSSSLSSRITISPRRLESTSRSPRLRSRSSMRSMAASICSVLTGRLRSAILNEPSSLARSYSMRRPSFLTMAGKLTSGRSYVVKRLSQPPHWRRRRMKPPSSASRVSTTWVSGWLQNGHFMAGLYACNSGAVDREAGRQLGHLGAHAGQVGFVGGVLQHVGQQVGCHAGFLFLVAAGGHGGAGPAGSRRERVHTKSR